MASSDSKSLLQEQMTILAAISIAFLLTQKWKLMKCTYCVGFWAAMMISILELYYKKGFDALIPDYAYCVKISLIAAIFCYIIFILLKPIMDRYD